MISFVHCAERWPPNLNLNTDICLINALKWKASLAATIVLLISGIYSLRKWSNRSEKALLVFHNCRAAISLLLLVINSFELARTFLRPSIDQLDSSTSTQNVVYIVIGVSALWNSLLAIIFTSTLIWFHRVVELKQKIGFLYLSGALSLTICVFRLYEFCEIVDESSVWELEPSLQIATALCFLTLAVTDVYAVYKDKYRVNYLEDYEKIGYKHNVASFYSKCCFWWLMPILWFGYKEPLELNDLGEMRTEDSARAHYDQFLLIYRTAKVKNGDKPPSLWYCYVKSTWRTFLVGGLLKLCGDLLALISPLAIQQIVQYIETMYSLDESSVLDTNQTKASIDYTVETEVSIYYPNWSNFISNGWIISWIILVAALAQGTFSQASTHVLNMTGIHIKTSLQCLIYRQTLLLSADNSSLDERSSNGKLNEEKVTREVGVITNLMSEDTLNVMTFFWIAHYLWAIPLKIAVVMYLLYLKLGVSAVIGSSVCILTMTPLQFLIGKAMSTNTEIMAKCSDERLKTLHDAIAGIRLIKLNAWEDCFIRRIRMVRRKELTYLNRDSFYWTLMTILTHISSVLITFVTLAVYVCLQPGDDDTNEASNTATASTTKTTFTASRIFSALALFQQLTVTLLIFPITVPIIIAAVTSTRRLEKFLSEREIQKKFEGIRHMARILSKSDASLDIYENHGRLSKEFVYANDNLSTTTTTGGGTPKDGSLVLKINDANAVATGAPLAQSEPQTPLTPDGGATVHNLFERKPLDGDYFADHRNSYRTPELRSENRLALQRKELLRNSPYVAPRPSLHKLSSPSEGTLSRRVDVSPRDSLHRDSLLLKMPTDIVVAIKDGSFAWDPDRCERVLRVHEVALPRDKLTICVGKNGSGKSSLLHALLLEMPLISGDVIWNKTSTIAFVAQEPWLLHDTIRENILFGESFRPQRYDVVLEACALKPDLEIMPEADFTIIGERGLNLSGGQRQRIAIARALYSSANVVIMDDPFSSLDNEVARHVFAKSINGMLLETNRTVILVTQQLHFVQQADYLIIMNDGNIQACGYYKDIETKYADLLSTLTMYISEPSSEGKLNSCNGFGRTARERWRLFKNVAKLGMQRSISQTTTISENDSLNTDILRNSFLPHADDQIDILSSYTPSLVGLTRKRSSVYGSRHLLYDVPLPIDECQVEDVVMRRRRRGTSLHRTDSRASSHFSSVSNDSTMTDFARADLPTLRVKSWQPMNLRVHKPVVRHISSPGRLPQEELLATETNTSDAAVVADLVRSNVQPNDGYQQFLRRMSMRRANKLPSANISRLQEQLNTTTKSILSISEETSPTTITPADLNNFVLTPKADGECETVLEEKEHSIVEESSTKIAGNAQSEPEEIPFCSPHDDMMMVEVENAVNKDDERKYGKIPTKIYMLYLRASRLPIVGIFFISAIIWQFLRVYTDVWLQHWTQDADAGANANSPIEYDAMYHFRIYMGMSMCCVLMAVISVPAGQLAGCFARSYLHDKLLESIMRKSLHFFQIIPVGRILNRFGNDMAIIDKKIAATSQRLLQFMLLCLCAVIINISITAWFVLLAIPIFAVYYAIQKFYRCSSRELQRIENMTNSPIISHLSETVQGVTTIRAYNQETRFTEMLFKRLEANAIAFTILNTSHRWLGISLDYLGAFIVFVAVVTALTAATFSCKEHVSSSGQSSEISPSPSLIGLAVNYTLLVPIYLNWVVKLLADIEMYVGSVERIAYYMDVSAVKPKDDEEFANTVDQGNGGNCIEITKLRGGASKDKLDITYKPNRYKAVPISWPQRGEILFENVTLGYEGQPDDVIKGLTLRIPAGQKIGICGRTGSGKSSLALSLFGVLQIRNGSIRIDDYDITDVDPVELRSRLSIIPQDVHLFNTSVRENLDPTGYFSDLQMRNALELAQLNDFVYGQLPQALDTQITDGGLNISAGQRQLFSLARAILRGSVCLVLDEATSSLDAATETALLLAAHKAFNGRTILTIAHRLSTILDYDRVIVLENGQIIEDGNPRDLQRKLDSVFLAMLNSARPISALSDLNG